MALALAWFLEDSARVELVCRQLGEAGALSKDEALSRTWDGGVLERMWQFLTASDVETARSETAGSSEHP
jgi:hypothetical protein